MADFIGTLFLRPTPSALDALRSDPVFRSHCYHLVDLPDLPHLADIRLPAGGLLLIDGVRDDDRRPDDADDEPEDDPPALLEPSRHFRAAGGGIVVGPDPFDPRLGMVMPPPGFLGWMQERVAAWQTPIHHLEQVVWGDDLCSESYWICDRDGCRGTIGVDGDDDEWIAYDWDGERFVPSTRKWLSCEPWLAFGCNRRVPFHEFRALRSRFALGPALS